MCVGKDAMVLYKLFCCIEKQLVIIIIHVINLIGANYNQAMRATINGPARESE